MKKTLVAVAALVATGAFAQVTISGVAEAAIASQGGNRVFSGGTNGASEITFGVSEDLGSGLKAMASTTICLNQKNGSADSVACGAPSVGAGTNTATTAPIAHYNSYVGLGGEFGSVKIGQQFSNTFLVSALGDNTGRAFVTNYQAGGAQAQVANALSYTSPSISGVSVSYQMTLDNTVAGYTNYAVNYSTGGFAIGYASGKTGGVTENIIGANYDFGIAKIFVGQSTATGQKSAVGYGVNIPFGSLVFGLGMGSKGTTDNTQFGVTYGLSKRTSVYAAQGQTTGTANVSLLGVRHNF